MSARFSDRVIWITGASSGIGAGLARVLSAQGAALILSARRRHRLEALAEALPGEALVLPLDLCDGPAIPAAIEQAHAWRGRIDVLINNAGVGQRDWIEDTELDTVRRVMEVNFFAVVDLTRQVLPLMLAQEDGHVVNMNSVAGYVSTQQRAAYSASKHALRAWSDSLRAEVSGHGLAVTTICPGRVKTEVALSSLNGDGSPKNATGTLLDSAMSADEAASRMATAIYRRQREFYVAGGIIYAIYLQRWFPGLVAAVTAR